MKIRGEIASIALPAIVTNITTPLLSLVDVAITGHIGEAAYIAAIALGGTVFNTLYWLFNFLRMGTTGLTAQAFGKGMGASGVLWRSLAIGVTLGLLLLALSAPIGSAALAFMDADDVAAALAGRYFDVLIWGAPAMLGTYAATGWLIGMQDTRSPLLVAIVTNVVNIASSCILVYGLHWTIEGVATGTLIAQWCGFILVLAIIIARYRPEPPQSFKAVFREGMWRFFRVNSDIFLRTLCLVAVTLRFTRAGAEAGVDILSANALLLQFFMFFSFFMDGFAFAGEALGGKYQGRADTDALHRLVRRLLRIGLACAAIFSIVYAAAGPLILRLLTDSTEVVAVAVSYLPWAVSLPLCGFAAFVFDGVFVGLTRTRAMLLSVALGSAVFFILLYSASAMANHALWLAFDSYLLVRGIVEAIAYRRILH